MFTCGLLRSNFSLAIPCAPHYSKFLLNTDPSFPKSFQSGAFGFLDDLFRNRRGRLSVMGKVHGEIPAALGAAPQVGGVAEHFRERDQNADHMATRARLRTLNLRAARVQVTEHGGHVFL